MILLFFSGGGGSVAVVVTPAVGEVLVFKRGRKRALVRKFINDGIDQLDNIELRGTARRDIRTFVKEGVNKIII